MGKELRFFLIFLAVLTVGFVLAEGNDTNNNSTSNNSSSNNESVNNTNLTISCIDTDGGKDYEEKGKVYTGTGCVGNDCSNITSDMIYDSCATDKILTEGYCSENAVSFINYTCSGICSEGRCRSNTTTTCTSDSNCQNGYECESNVCVKDDDNETGECEWKCTQWSICTNETQTRTCSNINNCTGESPKLKKRCEQKEDADLVCCRFYMKEEREDSTEIIERTKYLWVHEKECFSREKILREIMNDTTLCKNRLEVRERQRIKFEEKTGQECPSNCRCMGVVRKCLLEDGSREMTVFAGKSGNIIIQIKGVNMSTNVSIYDDNGTLLGEFPGGEIKIIKILPDEVRAKIKEKIEVDTESEEIELEEDGFYNIKANKRARLFWMFPIREHIETRMDPETGEVIQVTNRWWGFLARDKKSED